MDENKKETDVSQVEEKCKCTDSPLLKGLLISLLIFLGAFCASYVVINWHMKSLVPDEFMRDSRAIDRAMEKDIRSMNKILNDKKNFPAKQSGVIHMEQNGDEYRIIIDLRAFDNNENNVQVIKNNDNILTINGRCVRKNKHNEQISEFQQSYMFGENVKLQDMEKETLGNYLIIKIPIENGENEE